MVSSVLLFSVRHSVLSILNVDMKKYIIALLLLSVSVASFAQKQQSKDGVAPLDDAEILRRVSVMDVDGVIYEKVDVTIKSISPDYIFNYTYRVKATVSDKDGNVLWKKTLKNTRLYLFPDGQLQVGRPNFYTLVIYKTGVPDDYHCVVREREGVYEKLFLDK